MAAYSQTRVITLANCQRALTVDLRLLRRILIVFLDRLWPDAQIVLEVSFLDRVEMARINETYLGHKGSTDVITFDYAEPEPGSQRRKPALRGEIFVCLEEALAQSRRFHATWKKELVRYLVHGVLHLSGYDDRRARERRRMKTAENYWVRSMASEFAFDKLGRRRKTK